MSTKAGATNAAAARFGRTAVAFEAPTPDGGG
jgi:hypothetical protein